ncbi:MAG: hypothetical protein AABX48_02360 [Nanoarchaeota archaeon]
MIKITANLDELKKEIAELHIDVDINEIVRIDLPFIDSQDKFTIIHIPSYDKDNSSNIIFVAGQNILICSAIMNGKIEKKYEKITKKKQGESTVSIFILLKSILKNYSHEFLRIRDIMNGLELDPVLDSIEDAGRQLRKLTDRMEGLFQIIIELKEEEINCFNTSFINFDYEIFSAEARYWLERCRSHTYRIASLRTKSEMRSNRELNDTMKKLTVIMTFLTIVSIVVNVPGTVGAIFGIPALSDAYFEGHTTLLIITLFSTTILSMLLGFIYWKSLNLKR